MTTNEKKGRKGGHTHPAAQKRLGRGKCSRKEKSRRTTETRSGGSERKNLEELVKVFFALPRNRAQLDL